MKNLPLGMHTFERIMRGNWLYVDKTEPIYRLITTGTAYFLSRPRRFGKSLLVSTLKAIFEGQRDLFVGLWIAEQSDYAFEPYHVLSFDMSRADTTTPQALRAYLAAQVDVFAAQFGVTLNHQEYSSRFGELIERLGQDKQVVILIDEYDKPLLDHLMKSTVTEIRDILKTFYANLKASDAQLRFVLLTGVSKFSKVSIFSDLNNLTDISMLSEYADLVGITQTELDTALAEHLQRLSEAEQRSQAETVQKIRHWYNGYRFSRRDVSIYNPFSLLSLLQYREFKFYWFETGTPTFLLDLIQEKPSSWAQLPADKWLAADEFSSYQAEDLQPLPLLFQTGYLTIHEIDDGFDVPLYRLDYPNYEVQRAFLGELLRRFSQLDGESGPLYRLVKAFQAGQLEEGLELLKIFFAHIEYDLHINQEKYYQTIFFVIFRLLGFNIKTEVKTNRGRVDAVVERADTLYLFEFKLFDTAEAAMQQIKTLTYFQKFMDSDKEIIMVGVGFDAKTRNIDQWLIEPVAR